MCGRYRRRSDKQRIAEMFGASVGLEELYLAPEDDIAPGSIQPVVINNDDGERQIEMMRWGFNLLDRFLFNARSEAIDSTKFWAERFKAHRCIVPADGFFEWVKKQKGSKPKFDFSVPGTEPFGMAGLWSSWKNPKTERWEATFAILTGEANQIMRPIHDRQPIILKPCEYGEYLASAERPPVHLLRMVPDEKLKATPVSAEPLTSDQASLFDSL